MKNEASVEVFKTNLYLHNYLRSAFFAGAKKEDEHCKKTMKRFYDWIGENVKELSKMEVIKHFDFEEYKANVSKQKRAQFNLDNDYIVYAESPEKILVCKDNEGTFLKIYFDKIHH